MSEDVEKYILSLVSKAMERAATAWSEGREDAAESDWRFAAKYNPDAMYNLGVLAERRGDSEEAFRWFDKAALYGHGHAKLQIGLIHHERGDDDLAIRWYVSAANAGVRDAMYNLGNRFEARGETALALEWYSKAAEAGDADATRAIARLQGR